LAVGFAKVELAPGVVRLGSDAALRRVGCLWLGCGSRLFERCGLLRLVGLREQVGEAAWVCTELADGSRPLAQELVAVPEAELAVESDTHRDALLGVAFRAGLGDQQAAPAEVDGIVLAGGAGEVQGQGVVEFAFGRGGAIGRSGVGRGLCEPAIVAWQEAFEEGVGVVERGDLRGLELVCQAVLEGVVEALDAAFCLGAVGGDDADAQLPGGTVELTFGRLPASWSSIESVSLLGARKMV
jgi:hypothetical protein